MSLDSVKAWFAASAPEIPVIVTELSTATVALAAEAHGVAPGQIAKTLALRIADRVVLLVTRGDARLDNKKTKAAFGGRPRMLGPDEVLAVTSHKVGGVTPFGLPGPLPIYIDVSLRIYDEVIPAGGSKHASVRLTVTRLVELTHGEWVDCCEVPDP